MPKREKAFLLIVIVVAVLFILRNQLVLMVFEYQRWSRSRLKVEKLPLPEPGEELERDIREYLLENFKTPEEYVVEKFDDHDIVFLGEYHRIKHDPELVQALIPLLYRNGVYNLGLEFACFRDQRLIDALVTGEVYDQALANRVLFDFLYNWGYQEYADIFKAAWELNSRLPDDARRFRIVGLSPYVDWSYVKTEDDRNNPEVMAKVFAEGYGDEVMAKVILREFVSKGEKAFIYCGIHHAFTRYKQPMYDGKKRGFGGFVEWRTGNIVYGAIGERAFTICLHQPWAGDGGYDSPAVYPADGVIDALMKKLGAGYRRVGFDTRGTPFGEIPGKTNVYRYGYDHFTLGDFCDGYIYQGPLSECKSVTPIKGFINKENIELVRLRQRDPERKKSILWHLLSPATFDRIIISSDANIEERFAAFE